MAYEMYDYCSLATADSDVTLDVKPSNTLTETSNKNVEIHMGDDGSEERIALDTDSIFFVTLQWNPISEADSGTVMDFFNSTTKGCGTAKSFKWINHGEPSASRHVYVVRFASELPRSVRRGYIYGITGVKLKILGKIAD